MGEKRQHLVVRPSWCTQLGIHHLLCSDALVEVSGKEETTVNLREGTRRLALLLGGLGAIVGAIGSYSYLQPVMHQRELHRAFEQLATSDIVKQERKKRQAPPRFHPLHVGFCS
jgi:hypothetical protein